MSIDDLGLTTFNITTQQIPAVVLDVLSIRCPEFIPKLTGLALPEQAADQLIFVIIDNFGLYEIITYQPPFMIKSLENLFLIQTASETASLSGPILQETFFNKTDSSFNLISYLLEHKKEVKVFARAADLGKITNSPQEFNGEKSDVNIYVKAIKAINRNDVLILHFSDFDEMYSRYSMTPPADIASKIMRRTDKWLQLFWQQSVENTTLIVLGNNGRKPIDMHLEGKAAEWKRANMPIGFIKFR